LSGLSKQAKNSNVTLIQHFDYINFFDDFLKASTLVLSKYFLVGEALAKLQKDGNWGLGIGNWDLCTSWQLSENFCRAKELGNQHDK
jgi:hypothetical protein